ncbi:hypothetical protein [Citrobacter braakii]
MAPAIFVENGLDAFLEKIRAEVNEVPDLSTAKGRARIASLSAQVSRSKTAVEKPGRDYLKRLKEQPKVVEAELRRFTNECDNLRDEVRRPLTEWEADQQRLKDEEEARIAAENLAAQIESDHEIALLLNEKFDRVREEQRLMAEKAQRERDERLKNEAAEQAKRDAEEKHRAELEASARREADAKAAAERAEREALAAQERTAKLAQEAREQAEREKQEAIAAEQRKAQEEAARIKREAEQKEAARLAEEKRIADEAAARAADKEHRRTINRQVIADLVAQGIPSEWAEKCLVSFASGKVSGQTIKY